MLSPELLKKIKHIELKTSRLVNTVFSGEYVSAFKGRGMEFEEVREYLPGDDVRNIDWNVTARMNHTFVKEFREERELTMMLLVDLSSSGSFGSATKLKNEVAAEVAALLAYAAVSKNDKVGLIIFTDHIEHYIPPKKGQAHVWRLIKEILQFQPRRKQTKLQVGLEFMGRVLKRKSLVFVISDFIGNDFRDPLIRASHKHDVISVLIKDPRELAIPNVGLIELQDAETGEIMMLDTRSRYFRETFQHLAARDLNETTRLFLTSGIDHMVVRTDESPVDPIVRFFKMRSRRK